MVTGKAQPRDMPTGDIAKAQRPARFNDALERCAAGIGCAEDAAHAATGDVRDANVMLLKDSQDAKVRKSAGKAPAQGESNAWPHGRHPCTQGHLLLRGMAPLPHSYKMPAGAVLSYGLPVLSKQYECTSIGLLFRSGNQSETVRTY